MSKRNILASIGTFFGDIGRAREAAGLFERLDALSDDALAARGLRRDELAAIAFDTAFGGPRKR